MARFLKSRAKAKGAAPGSLIFMGKKKMDSTRIRLFGYDSSEITENEFASVEQVLENLDRKKINWLNIDGIHDTDVLNKLGNYFNISALALENILNTGQRPKLFEENHSMTVITKAVYYEQEENNIHVEQISFVIRDKLVISLQERVGDHFEPVRERIRNDIGRIRKTGADYLLYTLIDSLVDNYLINLEQMGSKIEDMEERLSMPEKEMGAVLFRYKTEVAYFRKTIRPLREVLTRLLRSRSELIHEEHLKYYQELYDLIEQAIEAADNYFNMTIDLINLYNTNLSNKANEVMKVLTIFASIFIPLTFIAGIYGTNFDYVPELHFRNAYFVMWGVMLLVAGVMLYYFRKNKWF